MAAATDRANRDAEDVHNDADERGEGVLVVRRVVAAEGVVGVEPPVVVDLHALEENEDARGEAWSPQFPSFQNVNITWKNIRRHWH